LFLICGIVGFVRVDKRYLYGEGWAKRSLLMKKIWDYACQECGVIMDGFDKECIQVHHVDGDRGNCSMGNLKVLCPGCHIEADKVMRRLNGRSNTANSNGVD